MIIGVVLSLMELIVLPVSALRILYELYTVKRQIASSPATVDLEETQTLSTYTWLFMNYWEFYFFIWWLYSEIGVT